MSKLLTKVSTYLYYGAALTASLVLLLSAVYSALVFVVGGFSVSNVTSLLLAVLAMATGMFFMREVTLKVISSVRTYIYSSES